MSKPIRVAKIIQTYYPLVGGAQQQIANVTPYLAEHNVEVHVITRHFAGLAKTEHRDSLTVHRVLAPSRIKLASPIFTIASQPILKKLQPDIIHAYGLFSPLTTAIAAKKLLRVPLAVKILRGGMQGDVEGVQQKAFGKIRLHRFKHQVDAFVVISQEIDRELADIEISSERRVFMPNGVDTNVFYPVSEGEKRQKRQELDLPIDAPIAIFTGRLDVEKRVNHLINIWGDVRQQYPNAHLLIAGHGTEEQSLKQIAGEQVVFLGRLDNVVPYLQAADIFALPSVTEGLSNSLLEAMAAGTTCLATAVGGTPELIKDGVTGVLVEPDNPNALHKGLLRLLADANTRKAMAEAAHQVILKDYQLQTTAKRLRNLYNQLLQTV